LRLTELIEGSNLEMRSEAPAQTMEIRGLSADSRTIAPGYLFAALPGSLHDGRDYIDDAIARGASAILAPSGTTLTQPTTLLTDPNPRRRFALLAARFHERQPETVVTVTGTNGKSSVADFTRQIWCRSGLPAASLGTLGLTPPQPNVPASLTTPDPVDLHRCLAALAERGFEHLVMEASSHGLDQFRLDGVKIKAAAFTNLSRDHLDYHGTMDAYWAAKQRLFDELLSDGGTAVLNADTEQFAVLLAAARKRGLATLSYGVEGSDLRLTSREATAEGQRLTLELLGEPYQVTLPLIGAFQAHNALAALGLAIATGVPADVAAAALGHLNGVPGRLEFVTRTPTGGRVYVDYAHTPDALETVLSAVRPHTKGRLVALFGCGGDRDRGKRPLMGEIAGRLADRAIVTDDNPRGEDPAAIRSEILAAVPEAEEVGERRGAIEAALAGLEQGDVLIVAGKGHETGQIVGDRVLPFDDRDAVRAAALRMAGGET
jgi:UDP-N-acetylmuramoyl-L-alanyl-D-glutamate--2,6-diaminopimelate ligase